jgi:hypothetical protein
MALSILDGNQSATTLSTILSSGQHITAHTVVSLGTQAITDIVNATSANLTNTQLRASAVTIAGTVTANLANVVTTDLYSTSSAVKVTGGDGQGVLLGGLSISGFPENVYEGGAIPVRGLDGMDVPISGTVAVSNSVTIASLPALVAGTAQIGSVTASISGTIPISISSVTVGNSVTIASLPALVAGTAQIGSVTASISNSVVTFYPLQGTTVTNSNFTSTTASTTLVSAVAGREVLTVFNEGAGNLHISPGATCTTAAYQVRLLAGDYWECPAGQLSLAHTAVFATAGTARVTEVS